MNRDDKKIEGGFIYKERISSKKIKFLISKSDVVWLGTPNQYRHERR